MANHAKQQTLTDYSETRTVIALAGSLLLPIPFLTTLNRYALQYPLDRLHYILFQCLFFSALPFIVRTVSELPDFTHKVQVANRPQRADSKAASTDATTAVQKAGAGGNAHPYVAKCAELEKTFMDMANQGESGSDSPWVPLASQGAPYHITVQGHKDRPFCFRITFFAPTLPGTAFDLLSDVLRRPDWDEMTEATRVVEKLNGADSIHYLKMKGIWPTAARDSLLVAHLASIPLSTGETPEFGYLNATQSIIDDRVPERTADGIVRMEAAIAGQLVTLASKQDREAFGLQGENWSKVVQLADGDLKGWIPKNVIKFIATQAMPRSLTKVNKQLASLPPVLESQLIRGITAPVKAGGGHNAGVAQAGRKSNAPVAIAPSRGAGGTVVRSRSSVLAWTKVILRYAGPAIIATITSLVFNLLWSRRRR